MYRITENQQVWNWLSVIMGKPQNSRVSEFFYFDRKDNEFFSILVVDYFLFEEDWSIPKGTSSNYSDDELLVLADRMKRIDRDDPSIIYLPPKGLDNPTEINSEIDAFLNLNSINLDSTKIWEVEHNDESYIKIDLIVDENTESKPQTKKKWLEFWKKLKS